MLGFIKRSYYCCFFWKHVIEPTTWELFIAWTLFLGYQPWALGSFPENNQFLATMLVSLLADTLLGLEKDVWCPPFFVKMLGLNFFVFNELKAQASLLNSLLSNVSEVLKICCRRRKGSSLMISRASKDWKECFQPSRTHFREMVFGSFILILFFLRMCTLVICNRKTCWKDCTFSIFRPQLGAMIQFDDFFLIGLKPPWIFLGSFYDMFENCSNQQLDSESPEVAAKTRSRRNKSWLSQWLTGLNFQRLCIR